MNTEEYLETLYMEIEHIEIQLITCKVAYERYANKVLRLAKVLEKFESLSSAKSVEMERIIILQNAEMAEAEFKYNRRKLTLYSGLALEALTIKYEREYKQYEKRGLNVLHVIERRDSEIKKLTNKVSELYSLELDGSRKRLANFIRRNWRCYDYK